MNTFVSNSHSNLEKIVDFTFHWDEPIMTLWQRNDDGLKQINRPYHPFVLARLTESEKRTFLPRTLAGIDYGVLGLWDECYPKDTPVFNTLIGFNCVLDMNKAYKRLKNKVPELIDKKYDFITQYQIITGQTMYNCMDHYQENTRLQLEIIQDKQGRFILITRNNEGTIEHFRDSNLYKVGVRFCNYVKDQDPDVIEVFGLERSLGFLYQAGIKLDLRRDNIGPVKPYYQTRDPEYGYDALRDMPTIDVAGRQIIDLIPAIIRFNREKRAFNTLNLKEIESYFGINKSMHLLEKYDQIAKYVMPIGFTIAQYIPQRLRVIYRQGTASTIDYFMLWLYLSSGIAIPESSPTRPYPGGDTDILVRDTVTDVYEIDVLQMYPSIIDGIAESSKKDPLGGFTKLIHILSPVRADIKALLKELEKGSVEYNVNDAIQSYIKRIIAAIPGYAGSGYTHHFNDLEYAESITSKGRAILQMMDDGLIKHEKRGKIKRIRKHTDGAHFQLLGDEKELPEIIADVQESLPPGIILETEGPYNGYFKTTNDYALFSDTDSIVKGAGLIASNIEPFIVQFIKRGLKLWIWYNDKFALKRLCNYWVERILKGHLRKCDIVLEGTCKYSEKEYLHNVTHGKMNRQPWMELMVKANKELRNDGSENMLQKGARITYYATGNLIRASLSDIADFAYNFCPENVNRDYYLNKLHDTVEEVFSVGLGMPVKYFNYIFNIPGFQLELKL